MIWRRYRRGVWVRPFGHLSSACRAGPARWAIKQRYMAPCPPAIIRCGSSVSLRQHYLLEQARDTRTREQSLPAPRPPPPAPHNSQDFGTSSAQEPPARQRNARPNSRPVTRARCLDLLLICIARDSHRLEQPIPALILQNLKAFSSRTARR